MECYYWTLHVRDSKKWVKLPNKRVGEETNKVFVANNYRRYFKTKKSIKSNTERASNTGVLLYKEAILCISSKI